jgi:DNA-binding PadR family transcriptional regulator
MLRERSMHPYEMQRVIHQRHTDELLALKRGSLYHAINQLQRDGLIEPVETTREGRRPERTVYRLTPDGEDELVLWLRDLLSVPLPEPSQFIAALAFIRHLPPADVLEQLEMRAVSLGAAIAALHAVEQGVGGYIGRVSVLEVEYQRALQEADLHWVRAIIDDLRARKLSWNLEEVKSSLSAAHTDVEDINQP